MKYIYMNTLILPEPLLIDLSNKTPTLQDKLKQRL